ncbi:MAG: hypothetical protein MUD06_06865, partial [Rhodospirillales bacterium]|nr:hypothetical protein [Rhodospirillales bacterium]
LFRKGALSLLYRLSGGVPRLINVICDRALLGAYVEGESTVTRRTVQKAAEEVFGGRNRPTPAGRLLQRLATAMTVLIGGISLAAAIYFFAPASLLETLRLDDVMAGDGVPAEAPAPLR